MSRGSLKRKGYQGVEQRAENQGSQVEWRVALKRGKRKALTETQDGQWLERLEHAKTSIRAWVEQPFPVIKNLFRQPKTRYRGLAKNEVQRFTLFGLANRVLAGRRSSGLHSQVAP